MYRTALTFKLKPGCYEQYKKAHDELWPAVEANLRNSETSMVIYHYHGRLFLFAAYPSEEHATRRLDHPDLDRFRAHIATLVVTDENGRSITETMDEAFVFGMFKDE